MIESKTYSQVVGESSFSLPFSDEHLRQKIRKAYDHIIVLDDDPTGTQTVHDIPVLTSWSSSAILSELDRGTQHFYILTNSRSLTTESAKALSKSIAANIQSACDHSKSTCLIISRSDSTLRGHYPLEVNVLTEIFQPNKAVHFIVPAFFEGGRFTKDDIHYVQEGHLMIPAGNTSFAKDKVFGYSSSNLKEWVVEKTNGKIHLSNIHSLSIEELESKSSDELSKKIDAYQANDVCIVNATQYNHLKIAIDAILSSKVDPYFRSAASLVAAFTLQNPKILDAQFLQLNPAKGGLIVLGSYVPKSTEQLSHLLNNTNIQHIEIDVELLLENRQPDSINLSRKIDNLIQKGKDVILSTSRKLISSDRANSNLSIGNKVSYYLTSIVSGLSVAPNFVIGKGGITSSDIATDSLKIKRAIILGQMIPGVPVWQTLRDSKFPNIPFIVFPGNVGDQSALTEVYEKLRN